MFVIVFIGDKENSIFCDLHKLWVHIKCNNLNNTTENHTNEDPDNIVKYRYYEIEEIQTWKILNKSKSLSMFYIMHAEF